MSDKLGKGRLPSIKDKYEEAVEAEALLAQAKLDEIQEKEKKETKEKVDEKPKRKHK